MPSPTELHRLPFRRHFQEGPGFRFLATQGGRPPRDRARADLARLRFRARCVRRHDELIGLVADPTAQVVAELGCAPRTLRRWVRRFATGGLAALQDGDRRPHLVRTQIPVWVDQVIITVRLLTYWNAKRIAAELRRRGVWTVSHEHIERLFAAYGTARPSGPRPKGPAYERGAVNSLWHLDIKGPFFVRVGAEPQPRKCYFFGLVDDHSRFLLDLVIRTDKATAGILATLEQCIDLCGVPQDVMTDNGSPFVSIIRTVLSAFDRRLEDLGIRHICTQLNSPWTNGKIERFWGILQSDLLDRQTFSSLAEAAAAIAEYRRYYNYHRLSRVLDWLTPAERFDGTPFTDRGFEHIPQLQQLQSWLDELMAAA